MSEITLIIAVGEYYSILGRRYMSVKKRPVSPKIRLFVQQLIWLASKKTWLLFTVPLLGGLTLRQHTAPE